MLDSIASPPANFDDVPELDDSDRACLAETARVWAAHGKLARFDVALAHGHFVVADGEVLIESNDPDARTLVIRPVALIDLPCDGSVRETQWQLVLNGVVASQRCRQACFVDLKDKHIRRHHYVR